MTKIVPVPLIIHLPPNAQLPRMRGMLQDLCGLLDRALEPARRFRPDPGNLENDVRLACLMHALNALDAGRAVHLLSGTDFAGTVAQHFRTIFEAFVKIQWMRKHPPRARAFLESEPFERYALATARVKKSAKWPVIIAECKAAVEQNPALLDLPKATKGAKKRPDFRAIAIAMRMPALEEMATSLGMDEDGYLIDHAVPSLTPHTSVVHVKNFPKKMNSDGTVTMSSEIDSTMLLAYVSRSATRIGEVLQEVLALYPDGKLLFDAEKVAESLTDVVGMLRTSTVGPAPATD